MASRTLIAGGYVVSMDPEIGELDPGWVLVEDGRIVSVSGAAPEVEDADVVDASGRVVLPGFVDTHRHTWQTQMRAIVADMSLMQYFRAVRGRLSPVYRPNDVYIGNLLGAIEALDAGVTTILDYSHCVHSPDHADAGITGLREAGIRAVYAYGYAAAPFEEPEFASHADRVADARRVRSEHFASEDGLLTMGLAITEAGMIPFSETRDEVRSAHELDALVAAHTGCFWGSPATMGIKELHHHGLLDDRQVHIHCNTLSDHEFRLLAEAGAKVSSSPESELSMGLGQPVFKEFLEHGLEPTLSCDLVSLNSGDMFVQMRLAMAVERGRASREFHAKGEMPESMEPTTRDILRWATQHGANALGMGSEIGSLTPGKRADVIVVGPKPERLHLHPMPDPVAAMVTQAAATNVDTVLVAGEFVKRDYELVADDQQRWVRLANESREHIFSTVLATGPLCPPPVEGFADAINGMAAAHLAEAYALAVEVPGGG